MKKNTRQKRRMSFRDTEIRSGESGGKKFVEGLIPYNSRSVPMWGTVEIIDRTAFNKTLADAAEVKALWNHDDGKVLGSTRSGTLTLENGTDGLTCRCELPDTSYANDLYKIIERGDVRTMSFMFNPVKWEDGDNGKLRTLKEVKLLEVSFGVAFPAYPETDSLTYMRGLEEMDIDIERLNECLEKEELTDDDRAFVRSVMEKLDSLVKEGEEAGGGEPEETTPAEPATSDAADGERKRSVKLLADIELAI